VGQKTLFLKNEPEKLLKTKDRPKKRTGKMAKRTEKRSWEVIENTYLFEKRTESEPERI